MWWPFLYLFFSYLCMLSCLSHIWLCVILWTVTCQAPLCHGILQARILEWVAMLSSRAIFLLYHIQIKTWTERNRRFKVSFYFAIKKWLQVCISGISSVFLIKFKKYFPIAQLFSVPYIWSYISNCRFFIKVILSHILGIRNFCVFCLNEILKKITDL